jgi:hypothetical protein
MLPAEVYEIEEMEDLLFFHARSSHAAKSRRTVNRVNFPSAEILFGAPRRRRLHASERRGS